MDSSVFLYRARKTGEPGCGEDLEHAFYLAFYAWFKRGNCDFWSEANAPEELAAIAAAVVARK